MLTQNESGRPLGQTIPARHLDTDGDAAHAFVSWICRLFTPVPESQRRRAGRGGRGDGLG